MKGDDVVLCRQSIKPLTPSPTFLSYEPVFSDRNEYYLRTF